MKSGKRSSIIPCALVLLFLLLAGCPNPTISTPAGALRIVIRNGLTPRTLLPSIDMAVASFTVTGTGPNGATFTVSSAGGTVTQEGLAFGPWTIVVDATNASGQLIGTGTADAQVDTGGTSAVTVSVAPVAGTGTLSIGVSWPASQVEEPSIVASLTPAFGTAQSLAFEISGSSASYSDSSVGTGYYTLAVTLQDNGITAAGAVEVVRIVAGQTTSGTYTFDNVNAPGGAIQVNISADMQDPLDVQINAPGTTMTEGSRLKLGATVSNYSGNLAYVWYVNGASQAMGPIFTFGTGAAAGYYRIDVTAFRADGKQAGSATQNVQVTPALTGPPITTIAGNGTQGYSGDGGAATSAALWNPWSVAVGPDDSVYVADTLNNRIRRVSPDGIITTVAGTGIAGYSGAEGVAVSTNLANPSGIALDATGNLYIADSANQRILKVTPDGNFTTVAGGATNGPGYSGDGGPATSANLYAPRGVAVDALGNIYIADQLNQRIRKVSTDGIITTVAGNGSAGDAGDGGEAAAAELNSPWAVAVDSTGALYIADANNACIRRVSPGGTITTVAGTGAMGYSGDGGPATSAALRLPLGVAVDAGGNIYIADAFNQRIRRVSTDGIITTLAGNGSPGYSGDGGLATAAALFDPSGVAVDSTGVYVFLADTMNNRVRTFTTKFAMQVYPGKK